MRRCSCWWKRGRPCPDFIFEDAPPLTRRAAEELAEYIEKTSGAQPEVIEGEARPIPEQYGPGFDPYRELLHNLDGR